MNESFETLRLAGRSVLHPIILARGAPNSDYFPILDLGAERARFLRGSASGYEELNSGRFNVVAALSGRRGAFGTLAVTPTPEVPRPAALSLGTRIRALHTLPAAVAATLPRDDDLRKASYRADELQRMSSGPRPPADWHAWMDKVVEVDADLHGGTAGVVDTAFFDEMRRFVASAGAPAEARAAVDFLHGIGIWNWPEAAVSARALMASTDTVTWIPDVLLRNGAAVAFVMMRDTTGAKDVLRKFAKRTDNDSFRERVIGSYLIYQDPAMRKKMGWK